MKNMQCSSYLPWLIWGLGALFYFYEYFLQVSPGVMVPELMHAFAVDATSLGNLAAFYFYAYATMQIPVGVLLDRFGPRRLLTAAAMTCMGGCLLFGSATTLAVAEMGRFLIGLGSAFALVGSFKLAANWFPAKRFALLSGLTVMIGMCGAIGGETPLALMVDHLNWRFSMVLLGIMGGLLATLIWYVMRDNPPSTTSADQNVRPTTTLLTSMFTGLGHVIRSKQTWLAALYGGLMFAPTSIFGSLWGVPFLMQAYHLSRPAAAGIISMMFIGWAVGSPLTGLFSDYIGLRRPPLWIGASGALIVLLVILYVPGLPLLGLHGLLFALGLFSSGFLPALSIIREINPAYASATALGFMNTLNMVGGAFGQPLIGWFLDLSWQGQMDHGMRVYSLTNYHIALALLPLCFLGALAILFYIEEPPHKKMNEHSTSSVTTVENTTNEFSATQ